MPPTPEEAANKRKRKNLTTAEKRGMIFDLLKGSNNGILRHGDLGRVADMYQQHRKTVSKYWKEYNKQKAAGVQDPDLHNRRKGNSGQKGVNVASLAERLKGVPLENRSTLRSIAAALDIPRSTLFGNLEKLKLGLCRTTRLGTASPKARGSWRRASSKGER